MQLSNNLTELKAQIDDLQQQIYDAVSPILNGISTPRGVELSWVALRFISAQEIGKSTTDHILDMPKIDVTINLDEYVE
jgi:hypothetical protein